MNIRGVYDRINRLKKRGPVVSNIIMGMVPDEAEFELMQTEDSLAFSFQERFRNRVFFAMAEDREEELSDLLSQFPADSVVEWQQRTDREKLQQEAGFEQCEVDGLLRTSGFEPYKRFVRIQVCYSDFPYSIPEEGRRRLLEEMYTSGFGEYPSENDVQELFEIHKDTFDDLADDVFTIDEWKKIVNDKRCMLYRENGKIVCYYIWELQGKKLYSNISLNRGPANYLYNIERDVVTRYWEQGIRVFYAWFDVKNNKALNRHSSRIDEIIRSRTYLMNYIYRKAK